MNESNVKETVKPTQERKPRGEKPQREQRAPKKEGAEQKQERPHQDSKEFIAMKAKQDANRAKIRAHIEELKKLNHIVYGLNDQRQGKFSGVAPELRARLTELNKQDTEFKAQIAIIDAKMEELIKEAKVLQGDLPKGMKTVEQVRETIEEKTYFMEHNNLPAQEEKAIKAEISKLEKLVDKIPAYQKVQAQIDALKAERTVIRDQQKPIIAEKRTLFASMEEQQKENQVKKMEREEIEAELKKIQEQRAEIEAQIKAIEKENEQIYEEFKKQQEVIRKQRDAERAQREIRDKMKPTIDKLYDVAPKVIEEPRFSCKFVVYLPTIQVIDELGQAKTGMIAHLQEQLVGKAETVVEKEISEKDKKLAAKRERQAKKHSNAVDFTVKLWMEELGIKDSDIDTPEKKKEVIARLNAPRDEALLEKIKAEKHAVILAVVEELKALGAEVTTQEFKPRVPEAEIKQ